MAWLFGKSSEKEKESNPPARQDRQKCWESRDAYFACLDVKGVVVPGEEGSTQCTALKKEYEKNCAKSWVSTHLHFAVQFSNVWVVQIDYFNQRRVLAEQQKESLAMAQTQATEAKRRSR